MFKKIILGFILTFSISVFSFAQDFSAFDKKEAEKKLGSVVDWMASGSSGLMWNTASASSTFGFSVGVYAVGSSFPEIEGASDLPKFLPNNAGIRATVSTMGAEVAFRILPVDQVNVLGFGAKYEFTKFLPFLPPGTPVSIAGYFDYNKFGYKVDDLEMTVKNTSFGVLASADFFLTIYGRAGFELGSGDISYIYDPAKDGFPQLPKYKESISIDSNGMRFAAGLKLLGISVEAGYRNYSYFGAGWQIGF